MVHLTLKKDNTHYTKKAQYTLHLKGTIHLTLKKQNTHYTKKEQYTLH